MKRKRKVVLYTLIALLLLQAVVGCAAPAAPAPAGDASAEDGEAAAEPSGSEAPFGQGYMLCDPDNPTLTPLSEFDVQEADSQIFDGPSLFVDYFNDFGQTFRITVDGQSEELAREYFQSVSVCYEAIETDVPDWAKSIDLHPLAPRSTLLAVISEKLGIPQEEVQQQILTRLMAGEYSTLFEILETNGADPDEVISDALQIISDAADAARNAGLLTEREFGETLVQAEELLRDLVYEEGATEVLWDSDEDTLAPDLSDSLSNEPESLAITVEWLERPEEGAERFAIYYVIDPCRGLNQPYYYGWYEIWYATAQVDVDGGVVYLGLYRWDSPYWTRVDYDSWTSSGRKSDWLRGGSYACEYYYAKVKGRENHPNNCWQMNGSWRYSWAACSH